MVIVPYRRHCLYLGAFKEEGAPIKRQLQSFVGLPVLLIALVSVGLGLYVSPMPLFKAIENLLLDARLQLNAWFQEPSDKPVMIPLDEWSRLYESRYPELGLNQHPLPRLQLAKLLRYANQQGAALTIFDVVFRNEASMQDDRMLEKALRGSPNAMISGVLQHPLSNEEVQELALQKDAWDNLLLAQLGKALAQSWNQPGFTLDTLAPLPAISPPITPFLVPLWRECRLHHWSERMQHFRITLLTPPSSKATRLPLSVNFSQTESPLLTQEAWVRKQCLVTTYESHLKDYPRFLELLPKKSFPLLQGKGFTAPNESYYCRLQPLQSELLDAAAMLGMTRVNYQGVDGKLRTVPVISLGYQKHFYPYAGLRGALYLLDANNAYQGQNRLYYGKKSIPLVDNYQSYINWYNPALGAAKEKNRALATVLHKVLPKQVLGLSRRFYEQYPYTSVGLQYWLSRLYLKGHLKAKDSLWFRPKMHWEPLAWAKQHPYWWEASLQLLQSKEQAVTSVFLLSDIREALYGAGSDWLFENHLKQLNRHIRPLSVSETRYWLGGSNHLYRSVPLLEWLLVANGKDLPVEAGKVFTIPNVPESGLLPLKDRVIVYGDALRDIHETPIGAGIFGPEILATALNNFWHDKRFIQPAPSIWELAQLLLIGSFCTIAVIRGATLLTGVLLATNLLVAYTALNFALFFGPGFWLPMLTPWLTALSSIALATVYRFSVQDKEKRQLATVFGNYVSPQVLEAVKSDPVRAMENLKGRKQILTVLFADLRAFTELVEASEPEDIAEQLNDYFETMTQIILRHNGTYDKYMGDAIMAFFGAPLALENHPQAACLAALEMQEALQAFNEKWKAMGRPAFEQGIGISTGPMLVGNLGSRQLKNFTVMGSAVNLGARLESYTREVGYPIIVSEGTALACQESLQTRFLGHASLKGFNKAQPVYALLSDDDVTSPDFDNAEGAIDQQTK